MQPFENVKIYKEIYDHPDAVRHSVRMPYISLLILKFLNRCQSKLAWLTPNLGLLWISVCSFWLCGSMVANPIIYRLVLSPSRFEIRQWQSAVASERRSREENRERDFEIPPAGKPYFWIVRTPVCGKNGLVERSTHVNQILDDPSIFPKGHFALFMKRKIMAASLN